MIQTNKNTNLQEKHQHKVRPQHDEDAPCVRHRLLSREIESLFSSEAVIQTNKNTNLQEKHQHKVRPQHDEDAPCVRHREHSARYGPRDNL